MNGVVSWLRGDLPREHRLLLAGARINPTAESARRLRELVAHDLDWDRVLGLACRHDVRPLLYRQLQAACREAVPPGVLESLRHHFLRNTSRNLFLSNRLLQLLDLFGAHGIRAIPYKGPVLTALAYGHLGLREFGDLDLLLHREDLARASELLLAQGYSIPFPLPGSLEQAAQAVGEVPLVHPDGTYVELHSTVLRPGFHFPLRRRRWEKELESVALLGKEVQTFSREQLLLILCAHGAKHLWFSLGWICDIAELLHAHPSLNWGRVLAQAQAFRSQRLLFIGLLLARELLQAPVPEEIVRRAETDQAARLLVGQVSQRLFQERNHLPGFLPSALFHIRSREHLRDGIRYPLSLAIVPHFADWAHRPLPRGLSWLYYLVRPLRLVEKGGGQLAQRLFSRRGGKLDAAPFCARTPAASGV